MSYKEYKEIRACIYRDGKVISSTLVKSQLMATIAWLILKELHLVFEFWASIQSKKRFNFLDKNIDFDVIF